MPIRKGHCISGDKCIRQANDVEEQTTTTTILYLTTLHLGAKKRSLKRVRAKTMYTINTIQI